jgi:erythrin-vacuolar iron transport family protein
MRGVRVNIEKSMKRDFQSLTTQEALHVAIFIEERNAEIYQQFAEMFAEFRDPESLEIAGVFWDMASEERQHGTLLLERYFERFGFRPCAVTEDEITDFIEVPRLDNGDLFAITRAKLVSAPRHMALDVAIQAENSALRYYTRLVGQTGDDELRELYLELAQFEGDHVSFLIRKRLQERKTAGEEA